MSEECLFPLLFSFIYLFMVYLTMLTLARTIQNVWELCQQNFRTSSVVIMKRKFDISLLEFISYLRHAREFQCDV